MSLRTAILDRHGAASNRNSVIGRTGLLALAVVAVLLVVFAPVAQVIQPFWLNQLTIILIFALFALSLDFVFGYAGLLSFGHAAMFGMGGYAAAFLLQGVTGNALVVLPAAVLAGLVTAAIIGWLSVRARGIYFAMLTLAFAQLFYTTMFNDIPATLLGVDTVTGGDNGLIGFQTFGLPGVELGSLVSYYYFALAIVALSMAVIVRLANSPFGRVLAGIRENEDRIAFLGYDVDRYKIVAFTISGGFAGLAGGLYVPYQSTAQPGMLHWTMSGELIVMTLLGGMGTLWGPMLGAALVTYLEDVLSAFGGWEIVLGTVYVFVVIFAPRGLAGVINRVREDPKNALSNVGRSLRTYAKKVRG